ncbi:hypothetical protein ERIC1_1c37220 [Paenibacillus larvae subsp. larvae DSM 25719]|nr:hypothetical protein ERIC1_1c37220 [Paenibacillus larvae subsp. larvae DSM 25719]
MSEQKTKHKGKSRIWMLWTLAVLIAAAAGVGIFAYWKYKQSKPHVGKPQQKIEVKSTASIQDNYDVIVVGTDPEGVSAAISAARNGQKTLLVDGRNRDVLGGLMTLGWLNSIDMNYAPGKNSVLGKREVLNKGIFSEWYNKIEGDSFDVTSAANAFYELVKNESNIDLLMKTRSIVPVLGEGKNGNSKIEGIKVVKEDGSERMIGTSAVIDATQDGDIMAEAGVPYTYGLEDVGNKEAKMAVTLVFRLKNVTPDVWKQIEKRLNGDNDPGTGANEVSAWGYKELSNYPAVNKDRVKMRGLNIGRQNDNTALINALQIFHIDGADPKAREEAFQVGKEEIPHVVDFMKKNYPEFKNVELDETAPELYIRETRHMQGEYRLTITDVLENKDQWDRVAFGSYPVDIQRLSPNDAGTVVCAPKQYAIPFRSLVPLKVDGLLVVGRAASYNSLPHGSARVIPVGMAEGQAAGVAAKLAKESNMSFRELSASKEAVAKMQDILNKQGMVLKPFSLEPQAFMKYKQYEGLKAVISLGLVAGGYKNEFNLDQKSNAKRMVNLTEGSKKMDPGTFKGDASSAIKGMETPEKTPLSLDQASFTITEALGLKVPKEAAREELIKNGLLTEATIGTIQDKENLTNGDTYMMIKDIKQVLKP